MCGPAPGALGVCCWMQLACPEDQPPRCTWRDRAAVDEEEEEGVWGGMEELGSSEGRKGMHLGVDSRVQEHERGGCHDRRRHAAGRQRDVEPTHSTQLTSWLEPRGMTRSMTSCSLSSSSISSRLVTSPTKSRPTPGATSATASTIRRCSRAFDRAASLPPCTGSGRGGWTMVTMAAMWGRQAAASREGGGATAGPGSRPAPAPQGLSHAPTQPSQHPSHPTLPTPRSDSL